MHYEVKLNIHEMIVLEKCIKAYLNTQTISTISDGDKDKLRNLAYLIGGTISDYNFEGKGDIIVPEEEVGLILVERRDEERNTGQTRRSYNANDDVEPSKYR